MYTGQLLLFKDYMPSAEFKGVKVTSVDNFQGMRKPDEIFCEEINKLHI